MPTTAKIDLGGQTSLQEAMAEFKRLTEVNESLERQVTEYSGLSHKLQAENVALSDRIASQEKFYKSQVDTLSRHKDLLQRKCVALITRLDVIRDTINKAEADAREEVVEETKKAEAQEQIRPDMEKLISQLPHNDEEKTLRTKPPATSWGS